MWGRCCPLLSWERFSAPPPTALNEDHIYKTSGALILDQIDFARHAFGAEAVERGLDRLEGKAREEMQTLLAVSWVDVRIAREAKDAIAEEVGVSSLALQQLVVRGATKKTIHKMWRMLLRCVWDSALVKRTPVLYKRAFNTGHCESTFHGNGSASFTVRGWPTMPNYDSVALAIGIESVLEYAGRYEPGVRFHRTGENLVFQARWNGASKETIEPGAA